MTLNELNKKYEGRPLDMKKWRFSGMAPMGSLALAANDVELDDGKFYDFNAIITLDGSAKPSAIALHGNYGCFARLEALSVRKNGNAEPMVDPAEQFINAIDTMIAGAFGLKPSTSAKAVALVNDVCPWDYPTSKDATREECDAAWEKIKRELVHYTARKYGFPEPDDLSEDPSGYPFSAPRQANFDRSYEKTRSNIASSIALRRLTHAEERCHEGLRLPAPQKNISNSMR